MTETNISTEALNAYVDGELSRAESASVARAAARNPAIAAQIATLRELKAAVIDVVPERELSFPLAGPRRSVRTGYAAVACVAAILVAASVYLGWPAGPSGVQWAQLLHTRHQAWSFTSGETAALILPAGGRSGLLPLDLGSARLTYVGHEPIALAGRRGVRTGYEGTRGCRVSLFVLPGDVMLDTALLSPSLHVRAWTIDVRGYVLMADGMPAGRFNDLARAVEIALRSGEPFDARTRQRLALARRTSPPCSA